MGKTKKLYLAKRILAMVLAAAMSVTMIPQTALAAPADDPAVENIVNDTADANNDADASAEEVKGEPAAVSDAADTDNDADADTVNTDKADDAGSDATDADKAAADADNSKDAEVKEDTPAAPSYDISIGSMRTEAVYNGDTLFNPDEAVVTKTVNGETTIVDDETATAAWKVQGADGTFATLTGEPVNVGVYELTLSCAAKPDVHDALEKKVTCTITKAPLTIRATASAKPGAAADKASVTAAVTEIQGAEYDSFNWTADVIALTVTGLRDAYGASFETGATLKKDGDYVADITAALKADADDAAKTAWNNYTVEPFTADVVMADLTKTRIQITLADRWKEADAVTRVYNKAKAAAAPEKPADYDYKVQYKDDTTTPASWKDLTDAELVGAWEDYPGSEKDADGKVMAPTNVGEYTYVLTYEDTKEGKYAKSVSSPITVVIDPAPVTVEIVNKENAAKITVPAGTKLGNVLTKVTYKATAKDGDSAEGRTIEAKNEHIWGTGYDDINVSQIYEPAVTLQVQNGSVWENIDNIAYKLQSGKKYRLIYDGRKAIYNADGSYAHRTGINAGYDENGEEINGADKNYFTDETPTADAKALEVEVQAGLEMTWDLAALYADGKAGATVEDAAAKNRDFDNMALYTSRSDYKNKVKLKGTDKTLEAVGNDFTYTWYKHNSASDLLDKQIWDQNKENGFRDDDFYDDANWEEWSSNYGESIIAPTDAGIYKLEISYTDNTDDGTFHYVKPDEKGNDKGAAYYVINKIALTITPEAGTYETLADRTPYQYFVTDKKIDEINYTVKKGSDAYTFPESLKYAEPQWGVLENITVGTEVDTTWYEENSRDVYFSTETGYTYEIQAQNLGRRVYGSDGEYNYFNSSIAKINNNYTLSQGVKKENEVDGKKHAYREDVALGGKAALTIKPMGTTELTFEAAATPLKYEKTYDGEALTEEDVKPETAYTLKANGQAVTDLDVVYTCVETGDYDDENELKYTGNAGKYDVYVNFYGNETYKPLTLAETDLYYGKLIGTVTIKQREVTLSLDVDDTYEAGYMTAFWRDINNNFKAEGYAEDDAWAFSAEAAAQDESAWTGYPTFTVNKKGSKHLVYEEDSEILHRGGEYEVRYAGYLNEVYDRNYVVKNSAEVLDSFKAVAKPAEVSSADIGSVTARDIVRTKLERNKTTDDLTQTYDVREGIPYTTYGTGENEMKGNLVAFQINAPEEFGEEIPDTAMYRNAVEAAGGKVVASNTDLGYFIALFDAATAENGEKKITIRWEDKYFETIIFKMNQNLCLGDLSKAVAPKSLAFNAAPKKLAVGESVQLDVKITKNQMTDVICLGYKSDDETTLHVDPDSGYVTALKVGKGTTITVYPKQMDKDGKMVPVPNFKEVKVAIEATALTAPKAVKAAPHGNYAYVSYDNVADGYRREIYVVEGKKKATEIEPDVKALHGNQNQWRGTFAIAPVYLDSADESYSSRNYYYYDSKNNKVYYKSLLNGLKTETDYTVYVRNVCEAKTLSDGYVITQATVDDSAAGTAVSFKTQKSEVLALDLKLDEESDAVKDITGYTTIPKFLEGSNRVYMIDYAKASKGVDSTTLGMFRHNASAAAADDSDGIILDLPLNDKTSNYQEPKLEYYVDGTDKNGNWVKASKNDYVSVDKKGKIKFTGVGGWYDAETGNGSCPRVYVRDVNTGAYATIHLWVVAKVDSVTAKKKTVNLTVGQTQDLNDIALYSYKAGKSKLKTYRWPDMDMDAVRAALKEKSEWFKLVPITEYDEDSGSYVTVSWGLRAIKGGGSVELSLTDKVVKENAENATNATVKITFSSKELAQVKKIKAVDVTNDRFGLTFTSAGYPDAFRVEIRDAGSNLLLDKRYAIDDGVSEVWERAKDKYGYVRVKDAYRIEADTIKNDITANGRNRLAKESQYTVKITALYGDVSSKEATAKVKTTKIPAVEGGLDDEAGWSWNYDKKCWVWNPYSYYVMGGMSIQVSEYKESGTDWKLDDDHRQLYVLSGNSYTLTAEPTNRGRVNDTLVWTIGDKKVASVKAAAGTYCITLKGLQPGQTTLEVKSKILNKTIARYAINVAAVGDAYGNGYRYFGDDEPAYPGVAYNPDHYGDNAPDYLPLSMGDMRKTKATGYFSFTASETGIYQFTAYNDHTTVQKKTSKNGSWDSNYYNYVDLGWMKEGQTVYLYSSASSSSLYYVEVEQTQRMETAANGMTVTGQGNQETFEFKAPKAGIYQFTLTNNTDSTEGSITKEYLYLFTDFNNATSGWGSSDEYGDTIIRELAQGETVWLKTSSSLANGKTYTLGAEDVTPQAVPAEAVSIPANSGEVYAFTANAAGIYRLAVTVPTANAADVTLKVWNYAIVALEGSGSPAATAADALAENGNTTTYVDMLL